MAETFVHRLLSRTEELLLSRTLEGRRLERDVLDPSGEVVFPAGQAIDRALLDRARELGLLEEVGHAIEPSTSDTELEDLLWWRKRRLAAQDEREESAR